MLASLLTTLLALTLTTTLLTTTTTTTHAAPMPITFGTGWSQLELTTTETTLFNHTLSPHSTYATMTHFWATGDSNIDTAIWRYYTDDDQQPSFQFQSAQVAGVGFIDQYAPWGNKWIGKGANGGAWYNNFRIPFHKNIRITGQLAPHTGGTGRLWTIFRGTENLPITVGNFVLPPSTKLVQSRIENITYQALDFVTLTNISSQYNGVLWAHYLSAASVTQNFMEGCYHAYTPQSNMNYPGMLVSTGMEDYFDSAFYFNGGMFHQENAGLTHWLSNSNLTEISAYRLHDHDPIFFSDGFRFEWRVGDVSDQNGLKCTSVKGSVSGDPRATTITAYTWVYVWPKGDESAVDQQQQQQLGQQQMVPPPSMRMKRMME